MHWIFWLIIFLVVVGVLIYNSLISRKNKVENAYSSLDVLLKKRADLIPNLVSAVKGYMNHEKNVLQTITELRGEVIQKNLSTEKRFEDESHITNLLKNIFVSVENYPDLKASQNFLNLQASLNEVEEQISAGRRAYNATVTDYNNGVEMFPFNLVATLLHFPKKDFFVAQENDKKAPSSHL